MKNPALCRDCFHIFKSQKRCPNCNSPRVISHANLLELAIAHIDCDAFYASIEKQENPNIRNLPVIVGGNDRGVVTTCCYIARINGVKSAMPIFEAKKLCPNAIIIKPRMDHYRKVSSSIKAILNSLSPAIEFVSIDEAYIDLKGTERLHGKAPAVMLAQVAKKIETHLGITVSIGLSYNKFLSKMGSELEKPRGFSVIGYHDSPTILKDKPVSKISGVGKKTKNALENNGIYMIHDLLKYRKSQLKKIVGSFGETLWFLARGIDERVITQNKLPKSISVETTFQTDQIEFDTLEGFLWNLSETISFRLKSKSLLARRLSIKLKDKRFQLTVKSTTLKYPSNLHEIIFQESKILLQKSIMKAPFRLIGLSISNFSNVQSATWTNAFFDKSYYQIEATEKAIDDIRGKFGKKAIIKGRSMK